LSTRLKLSLLFSFLIAVGGSVIADLVFDLSCPQSFFWEIILFIMTELFLLLLESDHSRTVRTSLLNIIRTIQVEDNFSNYFLSVILSRIRANARGFTQKGIEIPKEDAGRVWTACVANVDFELLTTSYVLHSEWWPKEYAYSSVELRKNKARQNKYIRILFLCDNLQEISEVKPIADDLKIAGITVSHASFESLTTDHIRSAKLKRIGTPDFGIIDGRCGFLTLS
jgi:hypothetical protein